jgi:adenylate cyclase
MTANREIPAEVPASRADGGRPFAAKRRGVGARSRDVEVLLGVAQRISGTESLDEIMGALVGMTSLAISCERCSFFLNDPGTDELYTRAAQGIRRQEPVRLLNNEGIAGAAFLTGQSIIVDDAYADPRFNAAIDRETGYVTKTVLCVPIRTGKGEVIGVAQALNKVAASLARTIRRFSRALRPSPCRRCRARRRSSA